MEKLQKRNNRDKSKTPERLRRRAGKDGGATVSRKIRHGLWLGPAKTETAPMTASRPPMDAAHPIPPSPEGCGRKHPP